MQHSFDIDIAKEYGILEAILLNNLWFWIEKNRANNTNYYDDNYWTYNSTRAFNELFPYVSQRQIQNALKRLIEQEILITGNYNKMAYDRTLWYAFSKKGKCIMQKCKMEDAKKGNGLGEDVPPIPDNKPDNKTTNNKQDINTNELEQICFAVIERLNELTGSNYKYKSDTNKELIKARLNEGYTKDDLILVVEKMCYLWNKEPKKGEKDTREWLRPSTLFRKSKFGNYLGMKVQQRQLTTKDLADNGALDFSKFRN